MPLFPPVPIRQVAVTQDGAPVTANLAAEWRLLFTQPWVKWFEAIRSLFDQTFGQVAKSDLAAQGAAVTTTPVLANAVAGLYRVTYYVRVSRAASTSSSVQVTLGWTDGGVAQTFVGTALTGNTTATQESRSVLVRADNATNITVAVAYASVGATSMLYEVATLVEEAP